MASADFSQFSRTSLFGFGGCQLFLSFAALRDLPG